MVIDALRGHCRSKDSPQTLAMAKSGYWHHAAAMKLDKYDAWCSEIQNAFRENNRYHGYHQHLKDSGKLLSEKVIRTLMYELGLRVSKAVIRKYNSYKGEITPAIENLVESE